MKATTKTCTLLPLLGLLTACADVKNPGGDEGDNHGLITTVVLTFVPQGGGGGMDFTWSDPDAAGSPTIDDIVLLDAEDYDVSVMFLNELEEPVGDVTAEVQEENTVHQIFFTGSAVSGPASAVADAVVTHAYADTDDGGLPLGLESTITTARVGSGELVVTLRHLPPEDGAAVKVAGLAEAVADGGFSAIGGDNDAQVTFSLVVE